MDAHELVGWWDEVVRDSGKGLTANLRSPGVATAARNLADRLPTRQNFQARARAMLGESFRDPAYLTLMALERGWESLGEKVRLQERRRGIHSQSVGNPPTGMETIRKLWSEPKTGPDGMAPLRAWLERNP